MKISRDNTICKSIKTELNSALNASKDSNNIKEISDDFIGEEDINHILYVVVKISKITC